MMDEGRPSPESKPDPLRQAPIPPPAPANCTHSAPHRPAEKVPKPPALPEFFCFPFKSHHPSQRRQTNDRTNVMAPIKRKPVDDDFVFTIPDDADIPEEEETTAVAAPPPKKKAK